MSPKTTEFPPPHVPRLTITDRDALAQISIETLTAYIERAGYRPSCVLISESTPARGRLFRHPDNDGRDIYVPNEPAARHHKTVQIAVDAIADRERRSALLVYIEMKDLQNDAPTPSVVILSGDTLAAINHLLSVEADGMEVCPDYESVASCSSCTADPDRGENMDCAEMRAHDRIYRAIASQLSRPESLRKESAA